MTKDELIGKMDSLVTFLTKETPFHIKITFNPEKGHIKIINEQTGGRYTLGHNYCHVTNGEHTFNDLMDFLTTSTFRNEDRPYKRNMYQSEINAVKRLSEHYATQRNKKDRSVIETDEIDRKRERKKTRFLKNM